MIYPKHIECELLISLPLKYYKAKKTYIKNKF